MTSTWMQGFTSRTFDLPETTTWALSDFFLGAGAGVQAQAGA